MVEIELLATHVPLFIGAHQPLLCAKCLNLSPASIRVSDRLQNANLTRDFPSSAGEWKLDPGTGETLASRASTLEKTSSGSSLNSEKSASI